MMQPYDTEKLLIELTTKIETGREFARLGE